MTNHDFLAVAGHPDDDECTNRSDGTDRTYCGKPKAAHERIERDSLDALTVAVRIELERSAESDVVALSDYAISLILEIAIPLIAALEGKGGQT